MPTVIPAQDTYLSPFSEDTPLSLGNFLKIYNIFMKIGDAGYHGFNSTRIEDISETLPNISARVYDTHGIDLSCDSTTLSTFSIKGGQVVVNNTLIELEDFTTTFTDTSSHWSTGGTYGGWDFDNNITSTATMCVLFEPYETDGTVKTTEPEARIVYVRLSQVDYTKMTPIWLVKVTKSGSTVTNAQLLLETSGVGLEIEQIGFWKNIALDGGDLD